MCVEQSEYVCMEYVCMEYVCMVYVCMQYVCMEQLIAYAELTCFRGCTSVSTLICVQNKPAALCQTDLLLCIHVHMYVCMYVFMLIYRTNLASYAKLTCCRLLYVAQRLNLYICMYIFTYV